MQNQEVQMNEIIKELGLQSSVVVKEILIGKKNYIEGKVIFINGLVNATSIDESILKPLMQEIDEEKLPEDKVLDFICKKYILRGDAFVTEDLNLIVNKLNAGNTLICLYGIKGFILVNTSGGQYRSIAESPNEAAVRGSREAFVESLETNIAIVKRTIKNEKLKAEAFTVGERSRTSIYLVYMEDIVDDELLNTVKGRIKNISNDFMGASGFVEQFIEDSAYSPFPQAFTTERPDRVVSRLLEGRVAVFIAGSAFVLTYPAIFTEFLTAGEDYYQRTLVSNFLTILRIFASLLVMYLSPIYLILISYNVELVPIKFILPIAQSRQGIPLPPFIEILVMEIIVEFLREGGLRLPTKVAATMSIVGGIIIGNAATDSKIVSPTTLLIVGISTVASFLIPNYEMALSLRLIKFPMLVLADALGFLGITIGFYFIAVHLFSLRSMGVPYLTFSRQDMKDTFIRYPLYKQNRRPDAIPNKDPVRQGKIK